MRAVTSSLFIGLVLAAGLTASAARAQDMTLKSGESMDLWPVYWISNCKSRLVDFAGIDLLEAPAGLALSLRQEPVIARRQGCPEPVPGAMVVVSAGPIQEKFDGKIGFRVRYNTLDGARYSSHTIRVVILP